MFKSLKRGNLSSYSKYQVEVTTTRIEDSSLLNSGSALSILKKGTKTTVAGLTALMMLMVMFVGMLSTAPKANAGMIEDIQNGFTRAICSQGAYGLDSFDKNFLSPQSMPKNTNPTMFEKYGFSGTSYSSWAGFEVVDNTLSGYKSTGVGTSAGIISSLGGNAKDSGLQEWEPDLKKNTLSGLNNTRKMCSPLLSPSGIGTSIGNIFLEGTKLVVWAGNTAFQASTDLSQSLLKIFKDPLAKIGNTLWDKLFFNYLNPLIMISALYLGWVGLVKRQTTHFFQSLIWIIAVVVFAIISWGNPMKMSQTVSSVTSGIASNIASSITSSSSDGTGLCDPQGKDKSVRQFQCNNYYNNVYSPWVQGQFGKTPAQLTKQSDDGAFLNYVGRKVTDSKFPMSTLKDTTGKQMNINKVYLGNSEPAQQNWALYYLDYRSNWDNASAEQKLNKNRSQMHVIAHELANPNYNRTFRGDNGNSRGWVAFIAFLSSIFSNALVVVISVSIIMLDIKIMLLGVVTPLYALAALHPGEGRTRAMDFLGKMLNFGIKKVVLCIYLAVFVVIMNAFAGFAGGLGGAGIQLLAVIAVGILAFKMKNEIISPLSNWSIFGASGGGQDNGSKKQGIASKIGSHLGAGALGGAIVGAKGLLGAGSKSSAIAGVKKGMTAGAGKAPQGKSGLGMNKAGLAGKPPQDAKREAEDSSKYSQAQAETGAPMQDDSGAGEAPQEAREPNEQASFQNENNRTEHENVDNSGSGEAPQMGTQAGEASEEVTQRETTPRQMKREAKVQAKAIQKELKDNGYRNRVGLGTVLASATKATAIGLATGNMSRAVNAGASTVNRKKQAIQQANAQVVKNVAQKHRDRNYEIARQQRQSEFEKAQAKRKAEREANQKKFAEQRAQWKSGKSNQQGKPASAPQQETATGKAPQQPRNSQGSTLNVSKPANIEKPRVSTPVSPADDMAQFIAKFKESQPVNESAQAPQISKPANYVNETPRQSAPRVEAPQAVREPRVEAPRVETPRQSAPAPQPVREPRVEAPRVETPRQSAPAPKQTAPRVEAPKQTAPRVEAPRQNPPAPPAPKPVAKESKPKASNPMPPAPPAPKAKVNPPKAPKPPTRRSLRESGNQTPPAPKPPQSRKS